MKTNNSTNDDVVIRFNGVSKKFVKSLKRSMLYGIKDIGKNVLGIPAKTDTLRPEKFRALDNVSFSIYRLTFFKYSESLK